MLPPEELRRRPSAEARALLDAMADAGYRRAARIIAEAKALRDRGSELECMGVSIGPLLRFAKRLDRIATDINSETDKRCSN
jgi:hypothetical protein